MRKETKPALSSEKKKLYVLGGLVGFLVLVVGINYLGKSRSSAPPLPPKSADAGKGADGGRPAGSPPTAPGGARRVADATGYGPISVLPLFSPSDGGDVRPSRNIFDYPPPPVIPPPPQKPITKPEPPTINLGAVSPTQAIAGTSKPIPVTLTGSIFPGDAQLLVNG